LLKARLPPSLLDQARGLGIRPGPDSVRPKAWLPKPLSYRAGPGPNGLRVGYTAAHWPFFVGGDKNLKFVHDREKIPPLKTLYQQYPQSTTRNMSVRCLRWF